MQKSPVKETIFCKRDIILRSLLVVATPYVWVCGYDYVWECGYPTLPDIVYVAVCVAVCVAV